MRLLLRCSGDPMFFASAADWAEVNDIIEKADTACPLGHHTVLVLPEWESKSIRKARHGVTG